MITSSELYWIISLDAIVNCLKALTILAAFALTAALMTLWSDISGCQETLARVRKIAISSLIVLVLALLGVVFVPTTSQALMIKTVPAIVNGEDFKNITGDAREIYRRGIIIIKNELDKKIGESVK